MEVPLSRPREVKTCERCRSLKRRCDLVHPVCSRCAEANKSCSFSDPSPAMAAYRPTTQPAPASTGMTLPSWSSANGVGAAAAAAARKPESQPWIREQGPSSQLVATSFGYQVPALRNPAATHSAMSLSSVLSPAPTAGFSGDGLITPAVSSVSPESSLQQDAPPRSASLLTSRSYDAAPSPASPASSAGLEAASPAVTENKEGAAAKVAFGSGQVSAQPSGHQQKSQSRKRKRTCLSCYRCHRLKVKCDKKLPCERCESSNNGASCYYNYNKGHHAGRFPSAIPITQTQPSDHPKAIWQNWQLKSRLRGASHWQDIMVQIADYAAPERVPAFQSVLSDIVSTACLSEFALPSNFPFGTPGAAKYHPRDAVSRLVEDESASMDRYIELYLRLLDSVTPILDVAKFRREVQSYLRDPETMSLCWVAQFLMVLGLGAFVSSVPEPAVATEFMLAAESCLSQTPYMYRPTFAALKALALMVVAKQICNATCWAGDSAWSLLGLLMRTCHIFGLPQGQDELERAVADAEEREDRRRLWISIIYLDARSTTTSGHPPLTRLEDLHYGPTPLDLTRVPTTFHQVLAQAIPSVLYSVSMINNPGFKPDAASYEQVQHHSQILRQLITHAKSVCASEIQCITLEIFLRRCLMALHHRYAFLDDGPLDYPDSFLASLECSLAIMMYFREIWAAEADPSHRIMGRFHVLDVLTANVTICHHLLRGERPRGRIGRWGKNIQQRKLIIETIKHCNSMWEAEKKQSVCWRSGYQWLVLMQELLPLE